MIGSAWMSSTSITLLAFWAGQANATRLPRLGLARGIQFQTLAKTGRGCSGVFRQCGPRNLHFEFHFFFSRGTAFGRTCRPIQCAFLRWLKLCSCWWFPSTVSVRRRRLLPPRPFVIASTTTTCRTPLRVEGGVRMKASPALRCSRVSIFGMDGWMCGQVNQLTVVGSISGYQAGDIGGSC